MRTRRFKSSGDLVTGVATGGHQSVLLHEALDALEVQKSDTVVDATLGGAGHAKALAEKLGSEGICIGIDADADAIERAKSALAGIHARSIFLHTNFRHLKAEIQSRDIEGIDKALFDLGWSSFQLTAGRGFSFLSEEPLGMAYDKEQGLTAETIVNEWEESSIADVLFGWGEERYARRIARAIVEARERRPLRTARELAEVIKGAVPPAYRYGRIHPATKTFQALRIAVNDELGALEEGMRGAWEMLRPQGRIAIITFHSLEDRIVKRQFLAWEREGAGVRITKKPLLPTEEELRDNPRARSAKLRVIEKY